MGKRNQLFSTKVIQNSHKIFLKNESRDLFYHAAIYLIDKCWSNKAPLTLAEAVSVLLQTWNKSYYRFQPFDKVHLKSIHRLLKDKQILQYRKRTLLSLKESEMNKIEKLFNKFEVVLGPIGAAKTLHLLANNFFPIWDRKIAQAYGLGLSTKGTNGRKFYNFMQIQKMQIKLVPKNLLAKITALKALDEYNYCRYTKNWI